MHDSSPPPIKIDLGFSIWLAGYLLLVHLAALVLILFLELDIYQLLPLATLIILSLIYHWRRYLLHLEPGSVIGIDWSANRGWLLRLKDGNRLKAELCPSSIVSRQVVILHFRSTDYGRRKIAIPGDAVDSDLFRRFRLLLKTGNHFGM